MTLTSSELSAIRADIANLLPDTCNILQLTRTSDSQGGWSEAWGTASGGTSVACRLDHRSGMETVSGAALQPFSGWVLTLPHSTTITTQNRISIGGTAFNIVSVDTNKSWRASVRCLLEKANP